MAKLIMSINHHKEMGADWNSLTNAIDQVLTLSHHPTDGETRKLDDVVHVLSHHLEDILSIFRKLDETRNDIVIQQIQQMAIIKYSIHIKLLGMIAKSSSKIHSSKTVFETCQVKSTRLLSNLGTKNPHTATIILSSLPWSLEDTCWINENSIENNDEDSYIKKISWTDLILISSRKGLKRGRKQLVGIMATIHNCITSLQVQACTSDYNAEEIKSVFQSMVIDTLFINTCIRQLYPPTTTVLHSTSTTNPFTEISDDATQWISFVLMRLSSMGLFIDMFTSLGTGWNEQTSGHNHDIKDRIHTINPEQILLLYCLTQAIQDFPFDKYNNHNKGMNPSLYSPVGNCFLNRVLHVDTLLFLANIWCSCMDSIEMKRSDHTPARDDSIFHSSIYTRDDKDTLQSICKVVMDILATSLSYYYENENNTIPEQESVRFIVGKNTRIFNIIIYNVHQILNISRINKVTPTADQEQDEDVSTLMDHVRMVGNLCYRCKYNQDLLRTTLYYNTNEEKEKKKDEMTYQQTGLHLLLSCTSMALHCFPLREWTIVAIRNALENNYENQHMVQELQAQHAINTPILQSIGIDLNLDLKGNLILEHKT